MNKLIYSLLLVLSLGVFVPKVEAQVGLFIRVACTDISSPVTNQSFCFQASDGSVNRWNGSAWVSVSATAIIGADSIGPTQVDETANYNWSGTSRVSGILESDANSPAALGASQNDYNPGTKIFLRLQASTTIDITGLSGGGNYRWLLITNIGASTITLKHQSASSTAANRFINVSGADITVTTGEVALAIYDTGSSRWRVGKVGVSGISAEADTIATVIARGKTDTTLNSFANRLQLGDASNHVGIYSDATDGPQVVCVVAGVERDCNVIFKLFTNRNFRVTGNTGTEHFNISEAGALTRLLSGTQAQGDVIYFNGTQWVRLAPGTAGQHLQTNGAAANPTWVGHTAAIWSTMDTALPGNTTIFLHPDGWGGGNQTTEAAAQTTIPTAITVKNMYVRSAAVPAGQSAAITLRKGGVDTALTCTIAAAGIACTDLVNTVAFAAGDTINYKVITSGGATALDSIRIAVEIIQP